MAAYRTFALFTAEGVGKPGLAVTVDVFRFTTTGTQVVTAASAIAIGGGYYGYIHNDETEGDYLIQFKTTDITVDAQMLGAMMSREQAKIGLPVTLASTQGPVTWDQQKFVTSKEGQGVIDIMNNHRSGFGINIGGMDIGLRAAGGNKDVTGFDPDMLNSIKGAGWTNQTLKAIYDAIGNISGGGMTGAQLRTELGLALANLDSQFAGIKAKTDNIPANPAKTGDAMTLTSAYDAAKSAASQSSVNAIPTNPLLATGYTTPDNAGIADIKAKTDNLPASPAAVGDAMTLTSAYDNAKQDVLTPLAVVDALVDILIARLTETRADNLDKLNVPGTLANTDNANSFKANISELATLTALGLLQTAIGELIAGIPVPDLTPLPTKEDLEGVKDELTSAIESIEIDTSTLATDADMQAVKAQTDQLQFTGGKIDANATVDLKDLNVAEQRTSNQILSQFVVSGKVTAMRGNNWEIVIPCVLPEGVKYQFALKADKNKSDEKAALFIDSEIGLTILNGETAADSTQANLAYHEGLLMIEVSALATKEIPATNYLYGIQSSGYGSVIENHTGTFTVTPDIIRSIG